MLDLELEHEVVATGTQIEGMKKISSLLLKLAMIIDGPWNWATYEDSPLKHWSNPTSNVEERETGEHYVAFSYLRGRRSANRAPTK